MTSNSIDPSRLDLSSAAWELYEVTPTMRRYRLPFGEEGSFIIRTEYLEEDALLAQNRQLLNESQTKRFGDGRVVARIPMNKLYQDFAGRWSDADFTRWYLNSDQAKPFRTFRGRV